MATQPCQMVHRAGNDEFFESIISALFRSLVQNPPRAPKLRDPRLNVSGDSRRSYGTTSNTVPQP